MPEFLSAAGRMVKTSSLSPSSRNCNACQSHVLREDSCYGDTMSEPIGSFLSIPCALLSNSGFTGESAVARLTKDVKKHSAGPSF